MLRLKTLRGGLIRHLYADSVLLHLRATARDAHVILVTRALSVAS
jgi:hypothetical protein